jgi:hypothetical protein
VVSDGLQSAMFTNWRRRRRIYNIILLLAVACIIALCFQFFLFGAISIYNDEHSTGGWFERGARPKYLEDAGDVNNFRHVRRVTRKDRDVPVQPVKGSLDCKDQNCSRFEADSVLDKYQNHAAAKEPVKMMTNGNSGNSSSFGENVVRGKHRDPLLFTDVWQYLEQVSLPLTRMNTSSILGASSRWLHLYQVDEGGFFTCILSRVSVITDFTLYSFYIVQFFNSVLLVT